MTIGRVELAICKVLFEISAVTISHLRHRYLDKVCPTGTIQIVSLGPDRQQTANQVS